MFLFTQNCIPKNYFCECGQTQSLAFQFSFSIQYIICNTHYVKYLFKSVNSIAVTATARGRVDSNYVNKQGSELHRTILEAAH